MGNTIEVKERPVKTTETDGSELHYLFNFNYTSMAKGIDKVELFQLYIKRMYTLD